MPKVTSKDGTSIAYDISGRGPVLVLVDGALCYRTFGPMKALAGLLSPHFSVITYDRRGRGESTNSMPPDLEREVNDIEALIDAAGGIAFLYGISSGACLALEAAARLGSKVKKLALYEPPYNSADARAWIDYRSKLEELLASNNRAGAVVHFMNFVGTPTEQVEGMRTSPVWPMFESVAPTLEYDAIAIGKDRSVPVGIATRLDMPVLVMNGTAIPFMLETAKTLSRAIPHGQQKTLEGQTHDVDLKILAPELINFFNRE